LKTSAGTGIGNPNRHKRNNWNPATAGFAASDFYWQQTNTMRKRLVRILQS